MRRDLWVIECRHTDGTLDLKSQQPESVFGMRAITGIDEDAMAKVVFAKCADVVLYGYEIAYWPSKIYPRWIARRKTW